MDDICELWDNCEFLVMVVLGYLVVSTSWMTAYIYFLSRLSCHFYVWFDNEGPNSFLLWYIFFFFTCKHIIAMMI